MAVLRKISGTTYAAVISIGTLVYLLYVLNPTVHVTEKNMLEVDKKPEKSSSNFESDNGKFVDVMFTFTNVRKNEFFIQKFDRCISTLLNYSSVPLKIHLITDEESKQVAIAVIERAIVKGKESLNFQPKVSRLKKGIQAKSG